MAPTPSRQPILINDGGSYSFTKIQSLKDFSGNFEIINVVSSINSNSSLSYKRSSDQSDVGSNLGSSSSKKRLIESSVEPEEQLSLKEKLELVEKEIMYNSCLSEMPLEAAHTDVIGLCNGKYITPDIIPPLEPDVISHVTHLPSSPLLDCPPYKLDYSVNQPTGTIHTIHPDVLNNPDEDMDTSKTSFVTAHSKTDSFYESDHSTAPQQQLNPSTNLDINVTRGLGPNYMYIRDDDVTTGDSIPSPCLTNKTEYLSANPESEFHSISPLLGTKDDNIDSSSPLSLVDMPVTLESDYSIIDVDEFPGDSYIGNDSQPLNYESIIPQRKKEREIDLPQPDNGTLLKEFPVEPVIPLRSVESPITFSDYIAREWIGTSENAQRVRNVSYHI